MSAAEGNANTDAISAPDRQLVQKLFDTQFRGYAAARLSKLKPEVLNEVVRQCVAEGEAQPDLQKSTEEKVKYVLSAKKRLQKLVLTTASSTAASEAPAAASEAPAAAMPCASRAARARVFKRGHEIHILAFNALKLRVDREELQDEWDAAVLEFATFDVLVISEVRASDRIYKQRAERLLQMLEDCTDDQWTHRVSEPSNDEVHMVIAKRPVDIVSVSTLHAVDGLSMDYAPVVACLDDPRFVGELRRFNVVGVHMPPKSSATRRSERDAQIRKLCAAYPAQAELRGNAPFTNAAAKETRKKAPYTAHIICGDFNASARELRELDVERHGWEIVFGCVRTSSGGMAYDNFLVSRDAKDFLTLGGDVLDLTRYANFSRGQQGISDHAPIVLRLTEVPPM